MGGGGEYLVVVLGQLLLHPLTVVRLVLGQVLLHPWTVVMVELGQLLLHPWKVATMRLHHVLSRRQAGAQEQALLHAVSATAR